MHVRILSHSFEFSDSMQALTEMVRELRKGQAHNGLVLANGGNVTYQYVVCLSNKPSTSPYPDRNPLPEFLDDEPIPTVDEKAGGGATIEVSFLIYLQCGV